MILWFSCWFTRNRRWNKWSCVKPFSESVIEGRMWDEEHKNENVTINIHVLCKYVSISSQCYLCADDLPVVTAAAVAVVVPSATIHSHQPTDHTGSPRHCNTRPAAPSAPTQNRHRTVTTSNETTQHWHMAMGIRNWSLLGADKKIVISILCL